MQWCVHTASSDTRSNVMQTELGKLCFDFGLTGCTFPVKEVADHNTQRRCYRIPHDRQICIECLCHMIVSAISTAHANVFPSFLRLHIAAVCHRRHPLRNDEVVRNLFSEGLFSAGSDRDYRMGDDGELRKRTEEILAINEIQACSSFSDHLHLHQQRKRVLAHHEHQHYRCGRVLQQVYSGQSINTARP